MRNDMVGKIFVMVSTNGDLPTNPVRLRECLICGEFFSRDDSRDHHAVPCQLSPVQPLGIVTRQG
jgi:hypothetical protein